MSQRRIWTFATEKSVVTFLAKHLQSKTAVIVSHRPALREICSRAYELVDHKLLERPHERTS